MNVMMCEGRTVRYIKELKNGGHQIVDQSLEALGFDLRDLQLLESWVVRKLYEYGSPEDYGVLVNYKAKLGAVAIYSE